MDGLLKTITEFKPKRKHENVKTSIKTNSIKEIFALEWPMVILSIYL